MTENEQALVQLLKAYDNGEIDFTKVPAIQVIIRQEVARQVAQAVNPAEIKEQASQQLKSDQTNYNEQVNKILEQQGARLQEQASQLDVEGVKQQLLADIDRRSKAVKEAQAALDDERERLADREKKQFWREYSWASSDGTDCWRHHCQFLGDGRGRRDADGLGRRKAHVLAT